VRKNLPKFFSWPSDFRIVLKNVNYSSSERTAKDDRFKMLVEFCSVPRTRNEMQALIGIEHREHFQKTFPK
jgi:ATP-dependent DNA helicase RecG